MNENEVSKEYLECWEALEEMKWDYVDGKKMPTGIISTQWSHLQDALLQGNVSKMECYYSIKFGHCMEQLKVRKSRYSHLM